MNNYPNKVYLSTSWNDADAALSDYVVDIFAQLDITVVGDHKDYQKHDPFNRSWIIRIDKLISDCSALVAIYPHKEFEQTTSPYMFPELLSASLHQIPIIIFHHQDVNIKITTTKVGKNIWFGGTENSKNIATIDVLKEKIRLEEIDEILSDIGVVKLTTHAAVEGPYVLPGTNKVDVILTDFIDKYVKPKNGCFVFNILPFSKIQSEHILISKAVFEETGLPCLVATDVIGEDQSMRQQWKSLLDRAEFVIAEFSEVRDACLFEAGAVVGLGKKVFLLSKNKNISLPYGLDDVPLIIYNSTEDLTNKVKERCCREYKRKVYNLDKGRIDKALSNGGKTGVPVWYMNANLAGNPIRQFSISAWLVSIAVAMLMWSAFVFLGSTDTPLAFASMMISFVFGASSHFRRVRQVFEERYLVHSNAILISSIIAFCIGIIAIGCAYYINVVMVKP